MAKSNIYKNKQRIIKIASKTALTNLTTSTVTKLILFSESAILSNVFQILIFICSQIQTISVLAKTALNSMPDQSNWFQKGLKTIHQVFSIADVFEFAQNQDITLLVLAVTLFIAFTTLLTFISFSVALKMNFIHSGLTQKVWSSYLYLYTHCLFYPIHFFGLKIYQIFRSGQGWVLKLPITSGVYIALIIFVLVFNFTFCGVHLLLFRVRTKTKTLLSSNISVISALDFLLKICIPIFWVYLQPSHKLHITLLSVNLFICLVKDIAFFRFLPFYHIRMLQLALETQTFTTAFAFSILLPKLITRHNIHDNLEFSALICLVLIPLYMYFCNKYFWKILTQLVALPISLKHSKYHLLHYWQVYKYFMVQSNKPKPKTPVIEDNFLSLKMAEIQFTNIISRSKDSNSGGSEVVETIENFQNRSPKTGLQIADVFQYFVNIKSSSNNSGDLWILKILLARFYLKNESSYMLADGILNEILKYPTSLSQKVSVYYLKSELLRKLNKQELDNFLNKNLIDKSKENSNLDVHSYIKLVNMAENLKMQIASQLKPQMDFWNLLNQSEVDVYNIVSQAVQVKAISSKIQKFWANNFEYFTESLYTKPLLIYSFYLSFAQNDSAIGDKLIQEYYYYELKLKRKIQETQDSFIIELLTSETLNFVVSGSPQTLGKILNCSNNIEKYFGFKKDFIIGRSVNNLMPTFFAERHDEIMQSVHEAVQLNALGLPREVYLIDKRGFLTSATIYLSVRFIPEHGLCYYALMRPQSQGEMERILVSQEGHILNFSEGFAKTMGLKNKPDSPWPIAPICPEFEDIIKAMTEASGNNTNSPPKSENIYTPETIVNFRNHSAVFKSKIIGTQFDHQMSPSPSSGRPFMNFSYQSTNKYPVNKSFLYQYLINRYTEGDFITFYPSRNLQTTSSSRIAISAERLPQLLQSVVYSARIQPFTYEGATVFKVSLIPCIERDQEVMMQTTRFGADFESPLQSPSIPKFRKGKTKNTFTFFKGAEAPSKKLIRPFRVDSDPPESYFPPSSLPNEENILSTGNELLLTYKNPFETDVNFTTENNQYLVTDRARVQTKESKSKPAFHEGDASGLNTEFSGEEIQSPKSSQSSQKKEDNPAADLEETQQIIDKNYLEAQLAQIDSNLEMHSFTKKNIGKLVKAAIKTKNLRLSTIAFITVFIATMVLQFMFLFGMSFGAIRITNQSTTTIQVIEALNFRLVWVNIANQEIRFINAIRGGWLPADWTYSDGINTIDQSLINLRRHNKKLVEALEDLESDFQPMFYENNIEVYGRDISDNSLYAISMDNTFQLADKILTKGYEILRMPAPAGFIYDFIDPVSRFIFDNSVEGFLTNGENLIQAMRGKLASDLSSAKTVQISYLSLILFALSMFAFSAFLFVLNLNKKIKHFLIMLLTSHKGEVRKTGLILSNFHKLLQQDEQQNIFIDKTVPTYFAFRHKQDSDQAHEAVVKNHRKSLKKASLHRIYRDNYFFLVGLYLILGSIAGFVYLYYSIALDNMTVINRQQNAVNVALDNIKKHGLISSQLAALIMENGETTVQGVPIFEFLTEHVEGLNSIVTLYDTFIKGQTVPPEIEKLLNNQSCKKSYMPDYVIPEDIAVKACNNVSQHTGSVGLLQIDSVLYNDLESFLNSYNTSDRSRSSLQELFLNIPVLFIDPVDVSIAFSLLLVEAVQRQSEDLNKKFENQKSALTKGAACISVLFAAFTWVFIMRKLLKKEFLNKDILNLLPIKMIRENQLLLKSTFQK